MTDLCQLFSNSCRTRSLIWLGAGPSLEVCAEQISNARAIGQEGHLPEQRRCCWRGRRSGIWECLPL